MRTQLFTSRCRGLIIGAGLSLLVPAVHAQSNVTVSYYSGAAQSYSIQSSGKLAFSSTDLLITPAAGATVTSIPLSIISKVVFGTPATTPTAVTAVKAADIALYPNPASATFSFTAGDAAAKAVKVFNLTGQQLLGGSYAAGEPIAIGMLPPGMYVVSVDSSVFKLVKY